MRISAKKVKRQYAAQLPAPQPRQLLSWYDKHRRTLPWRALPHETPDPYRVWLSEIMLQQTTVVTVAPYFQKFIERWPRLPDLAAASLDDVLRMWAGLGYYRRARMLHQCAQKLCADYKGRFPSDEKSLLDLPGLGPYTAAAIRTIAFDQPANVVDGNVERVMARIYAIETPLPKGKADMRAAAALLVPAKRCGDYAQALMDLGATVCTPRSPRCEVCPWQKSCQAYVLGVQETLPRREKAKVKPVRRAVAFVLINKQGAVFIRRRPESGLLAGMMEVPSSPWEEAPMPTLSEALVHAPAKAKWRLIDVEVRHVFTHFNLQMAIAVAQSDKAGEGHWVALRDLPHEALPSVMKKIVNAGLKSL